MEWTSWGCTVRGPGHKKHGIPNQDAWKARRYTWGEAAAVADGLGSKKHSDVGSHAACNAVLEAARAFVRYPGASVDVLLRLIHASWLLRVSSYPSGDCGTTCLFALRFGERLLLGRLGDGLIFSQGYQEKQDCLLTDEKEDSFSNMTLCLGDGFHPGDWEVRELSASSSKGVFLCTDGISEDILPERRRSFAQKIFGNGQDVGALRHLMVHWPTPGHSDDKTIACLVPLGGSL